MHFLSQEHVFSVTIHNATKIEVRICLILGSMPNSLCLIQSGFSPVFGTYSEPIEIAWRRHLSFYLAHFPIRDKSLYRRAITVNGNIYLLKP